MKIFPLILLTIIVSLYAHSQKRSYVKPTEPLNLVANGSFEDINTCTEFQALCEPEAWYFLPAYIVEPQGNDSNKYEMIAMTNMRHGGRAGNYIFTKLLCPLQEGKQYRFSIWINTQRNEFNHFDAYFTYLEPSTHQALNTITEPAFSLSSKHAEMAWKLWKKYTYTYIATGEERYLTLGNFSNEIADVSKLMANNKNGDILYAIDNVTLVSLDQKTTPCKEYFAIINQLYNQNYRHPARLIDKVPLDSSLMKGHRLNTRPTGKTDTLIIPDILFRSNSSKMNPAFAIKLQALVINMRIRHFSSIEVVGHTDSIGGAEANNKLSLNRAEAIRQYILTALQLPAEAVTAKGLGESQPKTSNSTPEGRQRNRRVEIILVE